MADFAISQNVPDFVLVIRTLLFFSQFLQIWYQNKRDMCLLLLMYFNLHCIKQFLKYIDFYKWQGTLSTSLHCKYPSTSNTFDFYFSGRLAQRSGTYGLGRVFWPTSTKGLPREEITIAEALKDEGYATGFVGKWHLGTFIFNETLHYLSRILATSLSLSRNCRVY